MRTKVLICAGMASAVLTGCGTAPVAGDSVYASTCDGKKVCVIPVTVVECAVTIPPDRTNIYVKNNNVAILWHLTRESVAKKYAFDPGKGVELKLMDGYFQFTAQGPVANDWAYFWLDRNTISKEYDYSINIIDTASGKPCPVLDPKIINN